VRAAIYSGPRAIEVGERPDPVFVLTGKVTPAAKTAEPSDF
jgi:hypothetical protein